MGTINIVEALESGEIKEARLQGTNVLSLKYPGNQVKHFRLNSLVADYDDGKPAKKKAVPKTEEKKAAKKKK